MSDAPRLPLIGPRPHHSTWQFYRLGDGALTDGSYGGRTDLLEANTPAGFGAIEGWHDPAEYRVDRATGAIVPGPSPADPPPTLERMAASAQRRRKALFAETEWVRSRAQDRGEPVPQAWLDYWQALRDITAQAGYPATIDWPAPPA